MLPSHESLANTLGVPFVPEEMLSTLQPDWSRVSPAQAREQQLWPCRDAEGAALFILEQPASGSLLGWLAARTHGPVRWGLTNPGALAALLQAPNGEGGDVQRAGEGQAVVQFVDQTIASAWSAQASDIHFETRRAGLAVRIRRDGVLTDLCRWEGHEPPAEILSRLKVMAQLDIAERRVPQDGRFSATLEGATVDFRVSIMPNAYGEDAVLRILDKRHLMRAAGRMSLDGLGFHGDALQALRALARRPHGMLLVTGPTGSGKTTTLYAAVSEVLSDRDKIITIEDPIEYELTGALQIPVNESKGLTFARGLRSILRHDPDTIFVGEIRDAETADIAVQAALTGHLVLTTVHANSVIDVIGRFIHMKLDLFSLVSALGGIVAQRLVRTRCTACAGPTHERAVCARCQGSGYHGRTVIAQAVTLDDTCRELIVERAPLSQLKAHLQRIATTDLQTEAQALIAQGRSTEEEVSRVLAFS